MLEILSRSIAHAGGIDVDPRARFFPETRQPVERPRRKVMPLVRNVLSGAWNGARQAWRDARHQAAKQRDLAATTG